MVQRERSNFSLFLQLQGIINFDSQIANRAFEFGVTEKQITYRRNIRCGTLAFFNRSDLAFVANKFLRAFVDSAGMLVISRFRS